MDLPVAELRLVPDVLQEAADAAVVAAVNAVAASNPSTIFIFIVVLPFSRPASAVAGFATLPGAGSLAGRRTALGFPRLKQRSLDVAGPPFDPRWNSAL